MFQRSLHWTLRPPTLDHPVNPAVLEDRTMAGALFEAVVQTHQCRAIALRSLRALEVVHCSSTIDDYASFAAGAG